MVLWRIYDHATVWAKAKGFDPLDGSGGLYTASRWNPQRTKVVYLGSSAALAVLETLVHVGSKNFGVRTLLRLEVDTPSIETVSPEFFHQLQHNSKDPEREEQTRLYGDAWAREGRSLLLAVPSAVIPFDFNYVMNPLHPEVSNLKTAAQSFITLDGRLLE